MDAHEIRLATLPEGLPAAVGDALDAFVAAARDAFGADLRAVVLFGSAAEARLRASSDVNVLVLLRRFDPEGAARLRPAARFAEAAVGLDALFLTEEELPAAAEAFAVKFSDMKARHVVLWGDDPLPGVIIPRHAEIARVRQVLLNLALRLRNAYVSRGTHAEHLRRELADAAGPLRASAHALLELEGAPAPSPREALRTLASETDHADAVDRIERARADGALAHGDSETMETALVRASDLALALHARAGRLATVAR